MNNANIDFAVAVKNMKDNILAHVEFHQLDARIKKAKYDALVKEGFTAEQALTLVKGT